MRTHSRLLVLACAEPANGAAEFPALAAPSRRCLCLEVVAADRAGSQLLVSEGVPLILPSGHYRQDAPLAQGNVKDHVGVGGGGAIANTVSAPDDCGLFGAEDGPVICGDESRLGLPSRWSPEPVPRVCREMERTIWGSKHNDPFARKVEQTHEARGHGSRRSFKHLPGSDRGNVPIESEARVDKLIGEQESRRYRVCYLLL